MDKKSRITQKTKIKPVETVGGRFARFVSTYTGGKTILQFYGTGASTDGESKISLPAQYANEDAYDSEVSILAKCFLAHEMGHIDVSRKLRLFHEAAALEGGAMHHVDWYIEEELYDLIPQAKELGIGIKPDGTDTPQFSVLMHGIERDVRVFCESLSLEESIVAQLQKAAREIMNALEDPRMEAMVVRRWPGTKLALKTGRQHFREEWLARAEEQEKAEEPFPPMIGIVLGCLYYVENREDMTLIEKFGPLVEAFIDANKDILDTYVEEGDWETALGVYDAYNAALGLACRLGIWMDEIPEDALPRFDEEPMEESEEEPTEESKEDTTEESEEDPVEEPEEDPDIKSGDQDGEGGAKDRDGEKEFSLVGKMIVTNDGQVGRITKVYEGGDVEVSFA